VATLSYSGSVVGRSHAIAIDIRRGYGCEYPDTPFEFLSNITWGGTAVPEPGAYGALTALGGLLYGIKLARRSPVKG
jgi:hypothetical protein